VVGTALTDVLDHEGQEAAAGAAWVHGCDVEHIGHHGEQLQVGDGAAGGLRRLLQAGQALPRDGHAEPGHGVAREGLSLSRWPYTPKEGGPCRSWVRSCFDSVPSWLCDSRGGSNSWQVSGFSMESNSHSLNLRNMQRSDFRMLAWGQHWAIDLSATLTMIQVGLGDIRL
jgi:hypothetical protein